MTLVPLARRHQRHELRLQVGREAGERLRLERHRLDARAVARNADAAVGRLNLDAGLGQRVERRLQELGACALEGHVAADRRNGDGERAGLDTVGEHCVHRAFEAVGALNAQGGRADAFDLGAHLHEALGDVADLRLTRGVLDDGLATG